MQKTYTPTTTKAWLFLLGVGLLVLLAACGGTTTTAPTNTPRRKQGSMSHWKSWFQSIISIAT
jgi:hypothetical protein